MRMWMVPVEIMCRQHLLGEHVEHHMFLGCLKKGLNLDGYVDNNLLELKSLKRRHERLVKEILKRGYNHNSPLDYPDNYTFGQGEYVCNSKVDVKKALKDLLCRCEECKRRWEDANM